MIWDILFCYYSESDHLVEEKECEQDLEGSRGEDANMRHHLQSPSIMGTIIVTMIMNILSITIITVTDNLNKLLCVESNEVCHLPCCELLACAWCQTQSLPANGDGEKYHCCEERISCPYLHGHLYTAAISAVRI